MNKSSQDLIEAFKQASQIPYNNNGSCRLAYLVKNSILKTPKMGNLYNSEHYSIYLKGVYQTLKEIEIWKSGKFNDIIAPIIDYGIFEGQLYTLNKKLIPANICLDEEDFDLEYFCRKMGCKDQYDYLVKRITSMSIDYNLDLYDLLDNEDNFGYDFSQHKVLLLDYGCCEQNDYGNADFLERENEKMFNNIFKEENNYADL